MSEIASETTETTDAARPIAAPPVPGPANPSPDGQTLAFFQRDETGTRGLWLRPLGEGAPRSLPLPFPPHTDEPDAGPQWSPDGTRLALVGPNANGGTAIWLIGTEDGEATRLVEHPASDRAPRWSPDGTRVAFVSERDGGTAIAVAAAPAGSGSAPATQLTDGTSDDDPAWSHDGALIAFTRRVAGSFTQRDICVVEVATGTITTLTSTPARRHSPRFAPDKPQIVYVTDEGEWSDIAIVNAENKAGWIVAGENGDKADPQWAPDGGRLLYTRMDGVYVRCCVRGMSWGNAETIDPAGGVARAPRWLSDGRAVYTFATPTQPPRFIVQTPDTSAERQDVATAVAWNAGGATLLEPYAFEFEAGAGVSLPGLIYRRSEGAGPAPGAILLDDGPPVVRAAEVAPAAQALAAAGLTVYAPNLHGTAGLGRRIAAGLREGADTEVEVADLADATAALAGFPDVDGDLIAVVGRGYGGALALLAAGGRPGVFQAVVAIDPVADWDVEIDHAPAPWRAWLLDHLGLPVARRGRYALRTPATFAAVIDVPLLLLSSAGASPSRARQFAALTGTLRELEVRFTEETVTGDPDGAPFQRAATFLRKVFLP